MNQIFSSAAKTIQILCNATRINLDPPDFHEQYVSFPLTHWHGINGDFFIRAQSVGITLKGEDLALFYLLQDAVKFKDIKLELQGCKLMTQEFQPKISGDGEFSPDNPCTFYLASISSGNLKGTSDLFVSRDEKTFNDRADALSNILFTQWIVKMMPLIEMYKRFKRVGILSPTVGKAQ